MRSLKLGEECFVRDLMETHLFSDRFMFNDGALQIGENIAERPVDQLPQAKAMYFKYLLRSQRCEHSHSLCHVSSSSGERRRPLTSLFASSSYSNTFLLPSDWMLLPVVCLLREHETTTAKATHVVVDNSGDAVAKSVLSSALAYLYLLELNYDKDYLNANVEFASRYIRLLYVFLLDSEVFLDVNVSKYLHRLLVKYTREPKRPLEHLDFTRPVDSVMSFYDFYQQLLNQYDACSFGDYVFSTYLVVPLQQCYSAKYRFVLFCVLTKSISIYLKLFIFFYFSKATILVGFLSFVQVFEVHERVGEAAAADRELHEAR